MDEGGDCGIWWGLARCGGAERGVVWCGGAYGG